MPASLDFFSEVQNAFPKEFITFSPEILDLYGKDWTPFFTPNPCAVVFPKTTGEVSRVLKLCSQHQVSVVPSGGRTGLSGGAVAAKGELVLSLGKMNRIDAVDPLAQTVRAQAGVITGVLQEHCAPYHLTWPVDFSSKGSSQIGGNISTNAGGVKTIRYGLTRQWVLGLQVVTMDGTILELNGSLEKNNTGFDLRQLFIGSEGTLGVITAATLKLVRLPMQPPDVFFFGIENIEMVMELFKEARKGPFSILAFEFLTNNCLEAVQKVQTLKAPLEKAPLYVLLEIEKKEIVNVESLLHSWLELLFERKIVKEGILANSSREAKTLWSIRESITEALNRQGIVHKSDIALPISNIHRFFLEMNKVFREKYSNFEVYVFGHIGDGNLHINILKPTDMEKTTFIQHYETLDHHLFSLVHKFQGSVSAEHGIGLLKKKALPFVRTEYEVEIFRAIKRIFDPQGLLNPGKIFDLDATSSRIES